MKIPDVRIFRALFSSGVVAVARVLCACTMDTLALYSFDDGSLAVASVSLIQGCNPCEHNASVWPRYKDPLQKKNWVKVIWPDEKAGRATGTTSLYAAQVIRFEGMISRFQFEVRHS